MLKTPHQTNVIGHTKVPWVYSETGVEYSALRGDAAVIDLSCTGLISVPLTDAGLFLYTVFPHDLASMYPNSSASSLLLDEKGRPVDLVTVHRLDDRWLVETAFGRGPDTAAQLAAQANSPGLADVRHEFDTVGIEGPYAWRVVRDLLAITVRSLPYAGIAHGSWEDTQVMISRTGYTAEHGYKLYVSRPHGVDLFQAAAALASPAGFRALELAMLEDHQPLLHREAGPDDTVLSCGYNWLVDLGQSDFTGRDAVLAEFKTGSAKRTVGVTFSSGVRVPAQAAVSVDGLAVGHLVHHAESPGLGLTLGVARVDAAWAACGIDLDVATEAGPVAGRTVPAPYLRPLSWSTPIE